MLTLTAPTSNIVGYFITVMYQDGSETITRVLRSGEKVCLCETPHVVSITMGPTNTTYPDMSLSERLGPPVSSDRERARERAKLVPHGRRQARWK